MLRQFVIVGIGGGLGSMARFGISYITRYVTFPYPTLFVNISGSFLIGVVLGLSLKESVWAADWKLFLATGICGGFTTFSAFSYENFQLIQNGKMMTALLYIGLSVLAGIAATWIGYKIAV